MFYICLWKDSSGNLIATRTGNDGSPELPEGGQLIVMIEHDSAADEPTLYVRGLEGMDELGLDNSFD